MKIPERQAELERFYREHLEDRPAARSTPAAVAGLPTDEQVIEKLLRETTEKETSR